MLTVACVLKTGGIYTPRHVARLRDQVAANMTQPYRFVCLSDIDVPCERIPLTQEWPGWWSKIELFKPGRFTGRVLYLDLDVTVVGSLDELADYPADFVAIKDYVDPTFNSSVMAWVAGGADDIFLKFTPIQQQHQMGRHSGDQAWIYAFAPRKPNAAHYFPRNWCPSYKLRCRYSVPHGAKVVVFHGKPKPWDLPGGHLVLHDRFAFD